MKPIEARREKRVLLAAVAGALALGLAACGDGPSDDQVGKIPDPKESFVAKNDQATDAAEQSADKGGDAMNEKSAAGGAPVDDAALTAKVKSALVAEPGLKAQAISVDAFAGVVTLRGTADSQENRRRAEQIASAVEGVRSVRNELVVIPG